jgi:hypothetical protein
MVLPPDDVIEEALDGRDDIGCTCPLRRCTASLAYISNGPSAL